MGVRTEDNSNNGLSDLYRTFMKKLIVRLMTVSLTNIFGDLQKKLLVISVVAFAFSRVLRNVNCSSVSKTIVIFGHFRNRFLYHINHLHMYTELRRYDRFVDNYKRLTSSINCIVSLFLPSI